MSQPGVRYASEALAEFTLDATALRRGIDDEFCKRLFNLSSRHLILNETEMHQRMSDTL